MSTDLIRTAPDRPAATGPGRGLAKFTRRLRPRAHDERGMATAEYAVGTIAAVGLVTVLINVFRNAEFAEVLLNLIIAIFKAVLGTKGFGL